MMIHQRTGTLVKSSRFKFEYRKNASKLHRAVGDFLRGSIILGVHEIYQEYPVNRVHPNYPNSSHHFDWVIPGLQIVIEAHGKQHFEPTAFDGNWDTALDSFRGIQSRDKQKKEAAREAGYVYIEVPYTHKNFNDDWLLEAIESGQAELEGYTSDRPKDIQKEKDKERRKEYRESEAYQKKLQRDRDYRKEQYRRMKELKNER